MTIEVQYDRNRRVITPPPVIIEERVEQPHVQAQAQAQVQEQEHEELFNADEHLEESPEPEVYTESPVNEAARTKETQRVKDEISKERSLVALRKRAEEAEHIRLERDELARKVLELQSMKGPAEDVDFSMNDDDLAEGKHLNQMSKMQKSLRHEVQELRKESQALKQQSHLHQIDMKIKSQYHDFDAIVCEDTITALKESHPEIARTLAANEDIYSRAVSAYTIIKNLGIAKEELRNPDKDRAVQNAAKPRSLSGSTAQRGDSPLSQANRFADGFTPALKSTLQKEMREAAKRW